MGIFGGIGKALSGIADFFNPSIEPSIDQGRLNRSSTEAPLLDARAPRTLVLGRVRSRGTSIMWHQTHKQDTGAEHPREAYTAVIALADHVCNAMRSIWIGDTEYTIGNYAGGEDFVLASETVPDGTKLYFPAVTFWHGTSPTWSWYVPNLEDRQTGAGVDEFIYYLDLSGEPDKVMPRIGFRFFDGTQTVPEEYLDAVNGTGVFKFHTDGGTRNRLFTDICYLAYQIRGFNANDTISPTTTIHVEMDGANDVHDWRLNSGSGGEAYTNNLVLGAARWMMWKYGPLARRNSSGIVTYPTPDDFDADDMKAEADYCDEQVDIKASTQTQNRHNVAAVISADQSPSQVRKQFFNAAGGLDIYRKPDTGKWTIRLHRLRTTVVALSRDDTIATEAYEVDPQDASLPNAIVATYRHANRSWQKLDTQEVTGGGTYIGEDSGVQSITTLPLEFVAGTRAKFRAERLAMIALDHARNSITVRGVWPDVAGTIKIGGGLGGASVLEIGDWVELTDSKAGWTSKKFRVAAYVYTPDERNTGLELQETSTTVRWDDEWDATDPAVASGVNWWRKTLDAPTGLVLNEVLGSGVVQADGSTLVTVILTVDRHPDERVAADGQYLWRLRETAQPVGTRAVYFTSSERFEIQLKHLVSYTFEAQVRTLDDGGMSAGGSGGVKSPWTAELVDTPQATIPLNVQPPSDPSLGTSLHSNPYWDKDLSGWADTSSGGSSNIFDENTDLAFPLGATQKILQLNTGSADTDRGGVSWSETVAVVPGMFLQTDVTLVSRGVGPDYDDGNHVVNVSMAWKDQDDNPIDPVSEGPIRDDEQYMARVGPISFDNRRQDPGNHGVQHKRQHFLLAE